MNKLILKYTNINQNISNLIYNYFLLKPNHITKN